MEVPFLGKTYALDLLQILGRGRSTFTGLLEELKISRTTLTKTLRSLVDEEYVSRENVGRYTVYRITTRGLDVLHPNSQVNDVLLGQIRDHVTQRLRDGGMYERYEIDERELVEEIQEQARRLVGEIVQNIERSLEVHK